MKERGVQFTETAARDVQDEREWWLANRDHQELFAREPEGALQVLAVLPDSGTPYTRSGTRALSGLRRDVDRYRVEAIAWLSHHYFLRPTAAGIAWQRSRRW